MPAGGDHYEEIAADFADLHKYLEPGYPARIRAVSDGIRKHLRGPPKLMVDMGGGCGMLTGGSLSLLFFLIFGKNLSR